MLMVILGAGASYDALPTHPPGASPDIPQRMPLADELFDERPTFAERLRWFPRCLDIAPRLHRPARPITVESALELLRDEATTDPIRLCQLAAVRFYLQSILWDTESRMHAVAQGVTNHRTLIDQIRHASKPNDVVCFVTFNYDRILETALSYSALKFENLSDYTRYPNFKLIKLHGSVNWSREIDRIELLIPDFSLLDPRAAANAMIDYAARLSITGRYRMLSKPIVDVANTPVFPAIAIPVQSKDEFECPPQHVDMLPQFTRDQLTKMLIIGWRGEEIPFRKLLADQIAEKPLSIMIVDPSATQIYQSLQNARFGGQRASFKAVNRGFTHFIKDPEIGNKFLAS